MIVQQCWRTARITHTSGQLCISVDYCCTTANLVMCTSSDHGACSSGALYHCKYSRKEGYCMIDIKPTYSAHIYYASVVKPKIYRESQASLMQIPTCGFFLPDACDSCLWSIVVECRITGSLEWIESHPVYMQDSWNCTIILYWNSTIIGINPTQHGMNTSVVITII